jgi:dipeptidyl aminopeptidase/acylaminoacyl peptidase
MMRLVWSGLGLLVTIAVVASVPGCGNAPAPALKDPSMAPCPAVSEERMLSIDDVLQARDVYAMCFSPDGSALAWVQIAVFADSLTPEFALQLTSLPTMETRQLFDAGYNAIEDLTWSPDGKSLAFLTSIPAPGSTSDTATAQVWTSDAEGGETSPLTAVPGGVGAYDWCGPGSLIYSATGASEYEDKGSAGADADDTVHVSQLAEEAERLYRLDVMSGETVRLTDNDDTIPYFTVSPDGNRAFMVRTTSACDDLTDEYYQDIPFENYLLDLGSGEERRVLEEVRSTPGAAWSADSSTLYVTDKYTQDSLLVTYIVRAHALDVQSGEEGLIPLEWERGIHLEEGESTLQAVPHGFIVSLADGFNPKLTRYTISNSGWKDGTLGGEHQGNIFRYETSPDGACIAYVHSTSSAPPHLCVASLENDDIVDPREVIALSPHLEEKSFTRSELISWEGAGGDVVEGMLLYPAGYTPGVRYPLMLMPHGGPFAVDVDEYGTDYQYPYQYMAQRGCFVLSPNYHGSRDYGCEFARSLQGGSAFYDLPLADIAAGIDRLVELDMVDPERLGTMGWSNGSILSIALIARDGRFKAASCGAGGGEWVSVWGGSASGYALLEYYFGVSPVEDPAFYTNPRNAPFYDAAEIKTPVVMYQGEDDATVPPAMSWITYRGIQAYAQAPVELFIFPGEGHEPDQVAHWRRKMVEDQAWFDRYFWSGGI